MAKDTQLDKMSVKELKELRSRVEKQIQVRQDQDRSMAKDRLKNMAEELGYSINDLFGGRGMGRSRSGAAAKYANPDDPRQTWTGRGRMPNWLKDKVNSGKKIETFRIA